jgi:hypothetical protein
MLAIAYVVTALSLGTALGGRFLPSMEGAGGQPEVELQAEGTVDKFVEALSGETPPKSAAAEEFRLELPTVLCYAVAAGPYETLREAAEQAERLMQRGAAGYVREEDGKYSVYLSAYASRDAAQSVAARLNGEDGMSLAETTLQGGGIALKIESSPQRAEKIKASFGLFNETLIELEALWKELDGGRMQPAAAQIALQKLAEKLENARKAAFSGALVEGESEALLGWDEALTACCGYLGAAAAESQTGLAISSKIKYTYLACVEKYLSYLELLNAA